MYQVNQTPIEVTMTIECKRTRRCRPWLVVFSSAQEPRREKIDDRNRIALTHGSSIVYGAIGSLAEAVVFLGACPRE